MAKCKNCKHLKYKDDGKERYAWCPFIGDNPDLEFERFCGAFKKMNNADRIRSMSDEELAELLNEAGTIVKCSECDECMENEYGCCIADCRKPLLAWLKSEVGCE